jgi:hypothetical protein
MKLKTFFLEAEGLRTRVQIEELDANQNDYRCTILDDASIAHYNTRSFELNPEQPSSPELKPLEPLKHAAEEYAALFF